MLGLPYASTPQSAIHDPKSPTGRISRYALGPDYHDVIHDKLKQLIAALQQIAPRRESSRHRRYRPALESANSHNSPASAGSANTHCSFTVSGR